MTRKEWLTTFLGLVYEGAAVVKYRKKLRLMPNAIKNHIAKIPQYEEELRTLVSGERAVARTPEQVVEQEKEQSAEKKKKEQKKKEQGERLAKAREARRKKLAERKLEDERRATSELGGATSGSDTEALGTRETDSEE